MESLNMNNLASSLPNSANAEKQLMDNFKAAALSITTLYRSSLDTSKRAYSAGYATCLRDVLHFVEAGVSVSGNEGEEMTIGRVMDWVEARLEAIKSTEEEEEEDRLKEGPAKVTQEDASKEEREKRNRKTGTGASSLSRLLRRSKENLQEVPQPAGNTQQMIPLRMPSTSPPAPPPHTSPSPPPPTVRPMRHKRGLKDLGLSMPFNTDNLSLPVEITPGSSPFTFSPDVVSPLPPVGSKRRHAAMLAESPASSSATATPSLIQANGHGHGHTHVGGRRKRGRSGREREAHHGQIANVIANATQGQGFTDAMEVEDEGRERKRVARR